MIFADTSIWADHQGIACPRGAFRWLGGGDALLGDRRTRARHLNERASRIASLSRLPQVVEASHQEAMHLLESLQLWARGIGYVDLHLPASVRLSKETVLWSRDERLAVCADLIGVGFSLSGSA